MHLQCPIYLTQAVNGPKIRRQSGSGDFMIGFFRFLKGYLRIRVWGYSPERFMNLCCNHDILLWDIEKCADGSYNMNISLSGYFQIRPFVRKTGTKVAVLNKFGLPFFIPHIKLHSFFWQVSWEHFSSCFGLPDISGRSK